MPPGSGAGIGTADSSATAPAALRLAEITVRFGSVLALADVTLGVPAGSITGLIGRNGAGKSTAIHLLAGVLNPDAGEVRVLGNLFADAGTQIRQRTGYLLSDPALFAYLTPGETLCFLGEAYGLPADEGSRRSERLLAFFGLAEANDRLVNGFSTGMQKRLALAAALIHAPRLLVLDEPFESLDPLIVRKVKQLLVAFREHGGSVLLSSHLIGAVEEICDRVVILERGQVVVSGSPAEARATLGALDTASLEELYAAAVEDEPDVSLDWL